MHKKYKGQQLREKEVKSFEELYGLYPTKDFINKIQEVSLIASSMAKMHRTDCMKSKDGIHHEDIEPVSEAIDFWGDINEKCTKWLKNKQQRGEDK